MIHPWQNQQFQQLLQAKAENRLPHALLFVGQKGIGKAHFADHFIRSQLCQQQNLSGCDCHSCRLIAGRAHPNVLWIEPEKANAAIKVDQIRAVTEFINQTSLQGEYRFVIINPANKMNLNAANALLKTLEEPASGSILVLITEQTSHLPATILSRAQHLHFPRPPKELAEKWLAGKLDASSNPELLLRLANGAPLAALQLSETDMLGARTNLLQILLSHTDPISAAAELSDTDVMLILDYTLSWIMDLLRLHLSENTSNLTNQDFIQQLKEMSQRISMQNITPFLDYILLLKKELQQGINLNTQLMIENILIRWRASINKEIIHVPR